MKIIELTSLSGDVMYVGLDGNFQMTRDPKGEHTNIVLCNIVDAVFCCRETPAEILAAFRFPATVVLMHATTMRDMNAAYETLVAVAQ